MSKVDNFSDLGRSKTFDEFQRDASPVIRDLVEKFNGKIEFNSNIDSVYASATFTAQSTEMTVPHTLGRVPMGRLVYQQTCNSVIYDTSTAWTAKNIYLASGGTGFAKLILF